MTTSLLVALAFVQNDFATQSLSELAKIAERVGHPSAAKVRSAIENRSWTESGGKWLRLRVSGTDLEAEAETLLGEPFVFVYVLGHRSREAAQTRDQLKTQITHILGDLGYKADQKWDILVTPALYGAQDQTGYIYTRLEGDLRCTEDVVFIVNSSSN